MSHADQGRFREIEREAFERYVLEVVRAVAAEEERLYVEARGEKPRILVRDVDLVRAYPETALRFRITDRGRDIEQQVSYPLWDRDYEEPGGRMKPASYIAGEMLRMVRGG